MDPLPEGRAKGRFFCCGGGRAGGKSSFASGVVFSVLLIVTGAALFAENVGWIHIWSLWRYWSLALIACGVSKLFGRRDPAHLSWAFLLIAEGIVFSLATFEFMRWANVWPLLLIGLGTHLLVLFLVQPKPNPISPGQAPSLNEWVVFSGVKRRYDSTNFQGGEIVCIFGGVEINLRNAGIAAGETPAIANSTVFGAIEIRVPEGWAVAVQGVAVFGAYEDKTIPPRIGAVSDAPKLIVTGFTLFGAVTVTN